MRSCSVQWQASKAPNLWCWSAHIFTVMLIHKARARRPIYRVGFRVHLQTWSSPMEISSFSTWFWKWRNFIWSQKRYYFWQIPSPHLDGFGKCSKKVPPHFRHSCCKDLAFSRLFQGAPHFDSRKLRSSFLILTQDGSLLLISKCPRHQIFVLIILLS